MTDNILTPPDAAYTPPKRSELRCAPDADETKVAPKLSLRQRAIKRRCEANSIKTSRMFAADDAAWVVLS